MNIEEVAFKDRKNLAQLNENDLLDIIEFLQNDRKQWINQFTQTHNESIDIQKENKELKKQLEEYQLQNIDLRADIMIQKMAFPNKLIKDKTFYDLYNMPAYEELLEQQKEFIKYLEDEIYSIEPKGTDINYNCEYDSEEEYVIAMQEQSRLNTLKEILQKYKEIIGDDK